MLLVTEFTTERGETFTVLQLLKRLRNAIIQIDGILFEHQERIETLEFDVEKLKDDVENIYSELLSIDIRLDTIDNRLYNIDTKILNIESNITSIETILNNHSDDILELNTLVTNITTELNGLQDIVDSIPIVSESPLNGYIKIDGVDVPVFIGDVGGTGGGSNLIHFNEQWQGTLMWNVQGNSFLIDLPEFDEFIELNYIFDVYINGEGKNCKFQHYTPYESESNEMMLQGAGDSVMKPPNNNDLNRYLVKCKILLIKNLSGNKYIKIFNSTIINKSMGINDSDYNYTIIQVDTGNWSSSFNKPKWLRIDMTSPQDNTDIQVSPFAVFANTDLGNGGGSGGSDENNSTVYRTKLNTLTNDDLNIYKNIWSLPCPPSAIGGNSCFEYDATYAMSVYKIDKIDFQCTIMGGEMNLGEININSFEEDFIFMKINLIGGIRKINDTEYFTSSDIEVIISNSNTSTTKTSRVLARLNSSRGSTGIVGVDDNIEFNMKFTGDEVEDRNSTMARGMLKSFYDIKELI